MNPLSMPIFAAMIDLNKVPEGHQSGFVSILGKPNAGKSTLLNAFLERKLVIATPKAQTTRHRVLGILNDEMHQIVFSDTPGVIIPQYKLHKAMMKSVTRSLEDADLVLLLIDVNETFPEEEMLSMVNKSKVPVILAMNKSDLAKEEKVEARMKEIAEKVNPIAQIAISALKKTNVDLLIKHIQENLPLGPPYFDKDMLSDRPERFFASEIIREKLFMNLEEELPYSTTVSVLKFEEEPDIIRIHAEIHVERKSQKGMIIGKRGQMIKTVGTEARKDLEQFFNQKVFLDLYVRVTANWKDSDSRLKDFGYDR